MRDLKRLKYSINYELERSCLQWFLDNLKMLSGIFITSCMQLLIGDISRMEIISSWKEMRAGEGKKKSEFQRF